MEEKQVLVRIEDLCKYFRLSSKEELKAVDLSLIHISSRWQAQKCPGATWRSMGISFRHRSVAHGQRLANRHPAGGFTGLPTSPSIRIRLPLMGWSGSVLGIAESRAFV